MMYSIIAYTGIGTDLAENSIPLFFTGCCLGLTPRRAGRLTTGRNLTSTSTSLLHNPWFEPIGHTILSARQAKNSGSDVIFSVTDNCFANWFLMMPSIAAEFQ
jgi:hypothetical protein